VIEKNSFPPSATSPSETSSVLEVGLVARKWGLALEQKKYSPLRRTVRDKALSDDITRNSGRELRTR